MKAVENIWLCADTHFGHEKMLNLRGFQTQEEMCQTLVDNINNTVPKTGKLLMLGDIVWNRAAFKWLEMIHCQKRIVMGNHDTFEPMAYVNAGVKKLYGSISLQALEVRVVLTHIPSHVGEFDRWDLNIHGHKHDEVVPDDRYVCVSVEQTDYKPIKLIDVVSTWKAKHENLINRNRYLFVDWS